MISIVVEALVARKSLSLALVAVMVQKPARRATMSLPCRAQTDKLSGSTVYETTPVPEPPDGKSSVLTRVPTRY